MLLSDKVSVSFTPQVGIRKGLLHNTLAALQEGMVWLHCHHFPVSRNWGHSSVEPSWGGAWGCLLVMERSQDRRGRFSPASHWRGPCSRFLGLESCES